VDDPTLEALREARLFFEYVFEYAAASTPRGLGSWVTWRGVPLVRERVESIPALFCPSLEKAFRQDPRFGTRGSGLTLEIGFEYATYEAACIPHQVRAARARRMREKLGLPRLQPELWNPLRTDGDDDGE